MDNIKKAEKISLISFLVLVGSGVLLHFAFEFSSGNTLVGAFTPVNESVWEHLKLILFPSVLIGIAEYFTYGKKYDGFLAAKSISILIGMLFILAGFYTYSGIIGRDYTVVNIALFVIAAGITSFLTYKLTVTNVLKLNDNSSIIGICLLTAVIILFIYFTFNPPQIELFRDPISEDFGISDMLKFF